MFRFPIISPLYIYVDEQTQIQFRRDDHQAIFITGDKALLLDLLPLLDGQRNLDSIYSTLSQHSEQSIRDLLQELKQYGIVIENIKNTCAWRQTTHAVIGKDLKEYSICVVGKDPYLPLVLDHLRLIGITDFVTEPVDADLTILCEPGLKPSFIEKWNRENIVPWLRASWTTSYGEVGPLFIPKQTACYQCFQKRLLSNRRFRDSYQNYSEIIEKQGIPLNLFAPSVLWCLSHILLEVSRYTTNYLAPQLCGRLLYMNLGTSEQLLEQVLQVPGCSGNCS